jgi:hypothetical protein
MKRPSHLLFIAIVAALSAGCASTPRSPTENLAADVLRGSSQTPTCVGNEILHCMTTATRTRSLNPQSTCECLVREVFIQRPVGH